MGERVCSMGQPRAVLWWRRTGVPWRDLPSDFGPWKTVFNRFDRWARTGVWERLLAALSQDRDDEWHSIDSTINRAHQHAAGGKGGLRCALSGTGTGTGTFTGESAIQGHALGGWCRTGSCWSGLFCVLVLARGSANECGRGRIGFGAVA
jgi:Putative transposase of IS4/5 family (DUF4096)